MNAIPMNLPKRPVRHLVCLVTVGSMLLAVACQSHPPSKPYDLVVKARNDNLTPINPVWYSQDHDNQLPSPDLCEAPKNFAPPPKPFGPKCTTQQPWSNGPGRTGCSEGHHNWGWVTLNGIVAWDDHDFWDDDYVLNL